MLTHPALLVVNLLIIDYSFGELLLLITASSNMLLKTVTQDIFLDYLLFRLMSIIFALPNKNISSVLFRICMKLKLVTVYLL